MPMIIPAGGLQAHHYEDKLANWSNNNMYLAWHLRGPVETGAVVAAIDALFLRHEALRTSIVSRAGRLMQRVWPAPHPTFSEVHVRGAGSAADPSVHEAVTAEIGAPFEMGGGPLSRIVLVHAARDLSAACPQAAR